jgi:branched-chain amino acid transport system ATP-binding protein
MRTLLEISDLKVRHGGAEVLKGISLKVAAGEIVTIIGSNGAGKTTTLRTISGLLENVEGAILFGGKRIDRTPAQEIVKMGIGHVPQGRSLFTYMSVLENIKLGAYLRKDHHQVSRDLAAVFRNFPVLGARKRQQVATLSGGEQQMVAIARALMGNPTLLLLDEPSIGLAPIVSHEIGKIALDINQRGTTILLVEQNARLALRLAHRGYVLETGSLVLQGTGDELLHDERVKGAYLGRQRVLT